MQKLITIVLIASLLIAGTFLSFALVDRIPPGLATRNRLSELERRIQAYAAKKKRLPADLSDLPIRPDYDDRVVDGWDKPVLYLPQKDGSVILSSAGPTGLGHPRSFRFSIVSDESESDSTAKMLTFEKMWNLESYLNTYFSEHKMLPTALSDLPAEVRSSQYNGTVDGWGTPIEYACRPDGSVVIRSNGNPRGNQIFSEEFVLPGIR